MYPSPPCGETSVWNWRAQTPQRDHLLPPFRPRCPTPPAKPRWEPLLLPRGSARRGRESYVGLSTGYRRVILRQRRRHLFEGPLYLPGTKRGRGRFVTQRWGSLVPWCIRDWVSIALLCFGGVAVRALQVCGKGGACGCETGGRWGINSCMVWCLAFWDVGRAALYHGVLPSSCVSSHRPVPLRAAAHGASGADGLF